MSLTRHHNLTRRQFTQATVSATLGAATLGTAAFDPSAEKGSRVWVSNFLAQQVKVKTGAEF